MSTADNRIKVKVKQHGPKPADYDTVTLHLTRANQFGVYERIQFSLRRGELMSALREASIEAPLLAIHSEVSR